MSHKESFNGASPGDCVALDICRVPAGLRFTAHGSSTVSVWIDPKHAPEIAISVLHAAGWPEESANSISHQILADLSRVVAIVERVDKEKELSRRRDELVKEFELRAQHYGELEPRFRKMIDRIIELQDAAK